MKTWVIYGKDVYSKQEKAREILLNNVSADAFVPTFVFDGVQYYKKIK